MTNCRDGLRRKVAPLVLVVAGITVRCQDRPDPPKPPAPAEAPREQDAPQVRSRFKQASLVDGMTEDQRPFTLEGFTTDEGVKLTSTLVVYPTAGEARSAFEERIRSATEVVQPETRDAARGERVVVTFRTGDTGGETAVLWRMGPKLWIVASSRLADVLELERESLERAEAHPGGM